MTGPSSGDRPAEEKRDAETRAACLANWPDAENGAYNPSCCRFPKSCSLATPPAVRTGDDAAPPCPTCTAPMYRRANDSKCPECRTTADPPPVSGTATRDDVARELRWLASWALGHTPQEIHAEALRRANVADGSAR